MEKALYGVYIQNLILFEPKILPPKKTDEGNLRRHTLVYRY